MANVFTYGSLMCADIMAAVCGENSTFENGVLAGYRRYAVQGEDYPGMVPAAIAKERPEVVGIVYRDVSDEGLRRLDVFEGDYYQRRSVRVQLADGEFIAAEAYIFRLQFRDLLADWPWDFEHFLASGKARFSGAYLGFQKLLS